MMPYTAPLPHNPPNADRAERNLERLIDRAETLIDKFETICRELPQDVQRLERTHAQVSQTCRQAEEQIASFAKHATRSQELSRINHEIFTQAEEQLSTFRETIEEQLPTLRGTIEEQLSTFRETTEEQIASFAKHATRSQELSRVNHEIFTQAEEQLSTLRETTEEQLSTLRGTIKEQLSTLRETTEEQLGKLREAIEEAAPLCLSIPAESERLAAMMRAHKAALKQVPRLSNDMKSLLETGNNQALRLKGIIEEAQHISTRQNNEPQPNQASVITPKTRARLRKRLRESVSTPQQDVATNSAESSST